MTNRVLMYIKRLGELFNSAMVCNAECGRENSSMFFRGEQQEQEKVIVRFHTLKNSKEEELSYEQLKQELIKNNRYKMVFISCLGDKHKIIEILRKVSLENGVCAPFVEIYGGIMYFPKLKYSDLGLLKYICEQNFGEKEYKILLASGN